MKGKCYSLIEMQEDSKYDKRRIDTAFPPHNGSKLYFYREKPCES